MSSIETEGDPQYWLASKRQVVTPERRAARNVIAVEGDRGGRQYRSLTAPLDFYIARRYISEGQYDTGDRLHKLWRGSIIQARYARMNFGEVGNGFDPENIPLMPRDYFRAMDAIRGFGPRREARTVCCFEEPCGGGKSMEDLKSALDDLVRHFRC